MRTLSRVAALALIGSVLAGVTGAAIAQDPIAARKAAMKSNGASLMQLVRISKGDEAFDAAKVKTAVDALVKTAATYDDLFPAGSDKGDTKADPKIWSDAAGFKTAVAKFREAVAGPLQGATKDVDGVKAALKALGPTCNACHDAYRKS